MKKVTKRATRAAAPRTASTRDEAAAPALGAPALALAVVLGRAGRGGDAWRVRVGRVERTVTRDPSVEPSALDDAVGTGARVVLDASSGEPAIVGLLATGRELRVDHAGNVAATVNRFAVTARDEAILKTATAFVQVKGGEAEVYGEKVVARAREIVRILGRMIKLN